MEIKDILARCDHTLLDRCATREALIECLEDARRFGCASACIPSYFVKEAKDYVGDSLKICTVIGFPNGYTPTRVKVFEAKEAIADGADEIDTVINTCHVKSKEFGKILDELKALRIATEGRILKVIIETCLLTEEEKITLCGIVTESGADFIKTSTGFSTAGATFGDVALLRRYVGENVLVKAAGGISSIEDAEKMIALGADRLGTSRIVKLVKQMKGESNNGNDKNTAY